MTSRTIIKCKTCGKLFETSLWKVEHGERKYCSRECYLIDHSKKLKKVCIHCGKEFFVEPKAFKNRKYCSRDCYTAFLNDNPAAVRKTCHYCKKQYFVERHLDKKSKFCDHLCYSKWRSEHVRGKNNPLYKEKIKLSCIACGKDFYVHECQTINKPTPMYCSRKCVNEHYDRSGERSANWKGGISFLPYCEKFTKEFKNRVREFFENKCVLCGKSEIDNSGKMSVHHVHYDKESCCDNSDNRAFVILCKSCHSKTNANRTHWIEYFEEFLATNYGGKCYYTKEEYAKILEDKRKSS